MAHRAGSSVVEHWSAVRRVPGSIPGHSIFCIVRVVRPSVTVSIVYHILLTSFMVSFYVHPLLHTLLVNTSELFIPSTQFTPQK